MATKQKKLKVNSVPAKPVNRGPSVGKLAAQASTGKTASRASLQMMPPPPPRSNPPSKAGKPPPAPKPKQPGAGPNASLNKLKAKASPSNTGSMPPFLNKLAAKASTGKTNSKASLHQLKPPPPPKPPKVKKPAKSRPKGLHSGKSF